MRGRPEEDSGPGYEAVYDPDAWQEFTPWRPGDPSTVGEAPAGHGPGEPGVTERDRAVERLRGTRADEAGAGRPGPDTEQRRGRWWTEDRPRKVHEGDSVYSRGSLGGAVFSHVPDRTRGRVVSTRQGMLGDHWATVEFSNGYTEEVKTERLERRGWLD